MEKILEMLNLVREHYEKYEGTGAHIILFLTALIFLFIIWSRKKNKTDYYLIFYSLGALVIYVCPLSAYVITKFGIGKDVYWRMFWLFPVTLLIAYICTLGVGEAKGNLAKAAAVLGCGVLIMISGQNMYRDDIYAASENTAHIPQAAIDVSAVLEEDAAENNKTFIKGVFDNGLVPYIRQYDGNIKMSYGRNVTEQNEKSDIYDVVRSEETTAKTLIKTCLEDGCNYIIFNEDNRYHKGLLEAGAWEITRIDGYIIYGIA